MAGRFGVEHCWGPPAPLQRPLAHQTPTPAPRTEPLLERRPGPRSKVEKVSLKLIQQEYVHEPDDHLLPRLPKTRAECASVPRPCPFISCRYHLFLDVTKTGSIRYNFPGLDPSELSPRGSCALDIADAGPQTYTSLSKILNVTRERVRQLLDAMIKPARMRKRLLRKRINPDDFQFEHHTTFEERLP